MKKIAACIVCLLLSPMVGLLGIAVLMNPSVTNDALCTMGSILTVTEVPDSLHAKTSTGDSVHLNRSQLTHARTIITTGASVPGVGRDGILIALMATLTESSLRMLANSHAYPESLDYPHDGDGKDHDSLGIFQMRPHSGWGTVAELMTPKYQAHAFFGGKTGPNYPSPRGLLDIDGWQQLTKSEAAQAVEVSAYPDRYQAYEPVANTIFDALTIKPSGAIASPAAGAHVPESSTLVFPLPQGTYTRTSPFGARTDPITGVSSTHDGTDYAAPDGTAIFALGDGVVTYAGMKNGTYGLIVIEHTINGHPVASKYIHMWATGIHVTTGQLVNAGQHIGDVGSSGYSTGPHLHLQIHPGGSASPAVNAEIWLTQHHTTNASTPTSDETGCAASP